MVRQLFRRPAIILLPILGLSLVAGVLIVTLWLPVIHGTGRGPTTLPPTVYPTATRAPLDVRARYATLQAPRAASTPLATITPEAGNGPVAIPRVAINIRSGPGMGYPVIGIADAGSRLRILARDASEQWWQIQHDATSSRRAWVAISVVSTEGPIDRLPVATGPG
jgi:hypothetical protein